MNTLLIYAVVLLAAVLISDRANRSIVSTSVLFLVAGFVAGDAVLGWLSIEGEDESVKMVAEVALFAVLFTDGMRVGIGALREVWRLPGRALLLGLPLTLLTTAALGHWLAGLRWSMALLVGAVLSPTDPVFASAIVGRKEVPQQLRRLLNVESGLNDGLALPIVIILLAMAGGRDVSITTLLQEVTLGLFIGIAIPWLAIKLEQRKWLSTFGEESGGVYRPIFALSVGLAVYAVTAIWHANAFLAAFAAGVTIATMSEEAREAFHAFGDVLAELLKLGALLLFGALIVPAFFHDLALNDYLFGALVLLIARPVALGIALLGASLERRQWLAAAWFGPKGFASVVYGLLILQSGIEGADHLFHLVALVVAASIIAHSSTDVLTARWLAPDEPVQ